jgi:hypothetical protein
LWLVYYAAHGDWPLLGVPLLFAWIDLKAVSFWRRREQPPNVVSVEHARLLW